MLRYLVSLQTLDVYVMLHSSWGAGYKTIYSICCKIVCWVLFFLSGKIHHAIATRVTLLSMENAKALHCALFGLQYNDPSLTVYFHILSRRCAWYQILVLGSGKTVECFLMSTSYLLLLCCSCQFLSQTWKRFSWKFRVDTCDTFNGPSVKGA